MPTVAPSKGRMLGRKPSDPRKIRRALSMNLYLVANQLPTPPTQTNWLAKVAQPMSMSLNDQIGDCTCAAKVHAINNWTGNNGAEVQIPDAQTLDMYERVTGSEGAAYDPNSGANDNGASVIDSLDDFKNIGLLDTNGVFHKLTAYLAFPSTSQLSFMHGVSLFGAVDCGVALPLGSQNQTVWDIPQHIPFYQRHLWEPGSWGGHDVVALDYNATGPIFATWGQKMQATWAWAFAYCQETYALFSQNWLSGPNGIAPNQLDEATLLRDLQLVPTATS